MKIKMFLILAAVVGITKGQLMAQLCEPCNKNIPCISGLQCFDINSQEVTREAGICAITGENLDSCLEPIGVDQCERCGESVPGQPQCKPNLVCKNLSGEENASDGLCGFPDIDLRRNCTINGADLCERCGTAVPGQPQCKQSLKCKGLNNVENNRDGFCGLPDTNLQFTCYNFNGVDLCKRCGELVPNKPRCLPGFECQNLYSQETNQDGFCGASGLSIQDVCPFSTGVGPCQRCGQLQTGNPQCMDGLGLVCQDKNGNETYLDGFCGQRGVDLDYYCYFSFAKECDKCDETLPCLKGYQCKPDGSSYTSRCVADDSMCSSA